jgi:hypothetical protein
VYAIAIAATQVGTALSPYVTSTRLTTCYTGNIDLIGKTMTGRAVDGSTIAGDAMTGNTATGNTATGDTTTGIAALLARSGIASALHMVPLALVSFYLMFAPVWAPLFTSRVYDDARYMQIGFLAVMVVFLALPRIRDGVLSVWTDLGRPVQTLWVVFLVGGIASAVFSEAPNLAALELGLVTQLAFLTLLVCVQVRRHSTCPVRASGAAKPVRWIPSSRHNMSILSRPAASAKLR